MKKQLNNVELAVLEEETKAKAKVELLAEFGKWIMSEITTAEELAEQELAEVESTAEELAEIKENTEIVFDLVENELWHNTTHKWDEYTVEIIKVLLDAEIHGYCPIALLDMKGQVGELEVDVDMLRDMCGIKVGQ